MPPTNVTIVALRMTARDTAIWILLVLGAAYAMAAMTMHSWTPGLGAFRPTPDGYQSVSAFSKARSHEFPALHPDPGPAPVAGTGHLTKVSRGRLYGTAATETAGETRPEVMTLQIERLSGPIIIAFLDVPLRTSMQEYLQEVGKGAIVTVAGIGHGDGEHNIYVYPVHRINEREP